MKIVMFLPALLLAGMLLWHAFTGFHRQDPDRYANSEPSFDLTEHLNGPLVSEGVIFGPLGHVSTRFVARMEGSWQGNSGQLKEEFVYAESGGIQQREWTLAMLGGGKFTATAADIVGTAHGTISGASARITYRLRLPEEAGAHVLSVTDWLYLMENGNIVNRSEMRKFGFKVAELVATIRRAGS